MGLISIPIGGADGSGESDSDEIDPEKDKAQDEASKQRKRAGLPELTVDTLPSSIATKMMNLDAYYPSYPRIPKLPPSEIWGQQGVVKE